MLRVHATHATGTEDAEAEGLDGGTGSHWLLVIGYLLFDDWSLGHGLLLGCSFGAGTTLQQLPRRAEPPLSIANDQSPTFHSK
jgi:hypothetical protein